MLDFLNALLPVAYIGLVSHQADTPELLEGHAYSTRLRNVTGQCFAQYRRCFYRFDDAIRIARHLRHEGGATDAVMNASSVESSTGTSGSSSRTS